MRSLKDYIDDTTINCRLSDKQESAILSAFELYLNDLEREQKCTIPKVINLACKRGQECSDYCPDDIDKCPLYEPV